MIELKHLQYLIVCADLCSFSKAVENVNQLSSLADEIGLELRKED